MTQPRLGLLLTLALWGCGPSMPTPDSPSETPTLHPTASEPSPTASTPSPTPTSPCTWSSPTPSVAPTPLPSPSPLPSPAPGVTDQDADGFPTCEGASSMLPCDCDDSDPRVYPGAPEEIGGIDEDCDGQDEWSAEVTDIPEGFRVALPQEDGTLILAGSAGGRPWALKTTAEGRGLARQGDYRSPTGVYIDGVTLEGGGSLLLERRPGENEYYGGSPTGRPRENALVWIAPDLTLSRRVPIWAVGGEARALWVDVEGRILVAGEGPSPCEPVEIHAFDPEGLSLWTRRFALPGGGGAWTLAADATAGSLYVAGGEDVPWVATLDSGGTLLETWVYDDPESLPAPDLPEGPPEGGILPPSGVRSLALAPEGGLLVGGVAGDDLWMARLDAGGAMAWQSVLPTKEGRFIDLEVLPGGEVLGIGVGDADPWGTGGGSEGIALLCGQSDGRCAVSHHHDGVPFTRFSDVAVQGDGQALIVGAKGGVHCYGSCADQDGARVFPYTLEEGIGDGFSVNVGRADPRALVALTDGRLVGLGDQLLVYTPEGSYDWTGEDSFGGAHLGVALPGAQLLAIGEATVGEVSHPLMTRWSGEGRYLGRAIYETPEGGKLLDAVAIPGGGIHAVGEGRSEAGVTPWLLRLDDSGRLIEDLSPGAKGMGALRAIALLPGGEVLVGGWRTDAKGEVEGWVALLSVEGALLWELVVEGLTDAGITAVATAGDGRLYVGGTLAGEEGGFDQGWVGEVSREAALLGSWRAPRDPSVERMDSEVRALVPTAAGLEALWVAQEHCKELTMAYITALDENLAEQAQGRGWSVSRPWTDLAPTPDGGSAFVWRSGRYYYASWYGACDYSSFDPPLYLEKRAAYAPAPL